MPTFRITPIAFGPAQPVRRTRGRNAKPGTFDLHCKMCPFCLPDQGHYCMTAEDLRWAEEEPTAEGQL